MTRTANHEPRKAGNRRAYMVSLYKWRSITALFAGSLTFFISFIGVMFGMIHQIEVEHSPGIQFFQFFTFQTNALNVLAAGVLIPFAVEGIRKKRFVCPRWVSLLHCSAVNSSLIVMFFTLACISWFDPVKAFGGSNLYLHIIVPILVFSAFMLVESLHPFSVKDALLCLVPYLCYALLYLTFAVFIGEENGGWMDLYYLKNLMPLWISIPIMMLLGLIVAFLTRWIHNRLVTVNRRKLFSCWDGKADPVEIRVEAFGLGRYLGMHCDAENVDIPLDILQHLAKQYQIPVEALVKPFTRGMLDGQADRERFLCSRHNQ